MLKDYEYATSSISEEVAWANRVIHNMQQKKKDMSKKRLACFLYYLFLYAFSIPSNIIRFMLSVFILCIFEHIRNYNVIATPLAFYAIFAVSFAVLSIILNICGEFDDTAQSLYKDAHYF